MKKIILPLTAVTITGASASSMVSCTKPGWTQGEIGERLVLITDSGRIHDKSFNQSSYEALTTYSDQTPYTDEHGVDYGGFDFKTRGLSAARNYIEPLTTDSFSLISAYKIAMIKGTDILVLPGFMHNGTVDQAARLLGPQKGIVFADSDAGTEPTIINLVYNSQLAGFAAAWDTAIWATQPDPKNPGYMQGDIHRHEYVSFATFGGISSKLAVDNFMWGMMVAIRAWNLRVDINESTPSPRHIYFANDSKKGEVQNASNIDTQNSRYFSGSFEPAGSIKSGTTSGLYANEADVIFPIAGPQTADVLNYSNRAYLIGVDTDQSLQYTASANRFVTSAVKDLVQSIHDAIDHSKANRNNWNEDGTLMETPKVGGIYWEKGDLGGKPAPAQLSWSVDIDQTKNPIGSKIPKTVLDYADVDKWGEFVDKMNDYYMNAGSSVTEYMSPNTISGIAKWIDENYGKNVPVEKQLPIEFDN